MQQRNRVLWLGAGNPAPIWTFSLVVPCADTKPQISITYRKEFPEIKKNKHKSRIVLSQIENKTRYDEQRKKMDVIRNL